MLSLIISLFILHFTLVSSGSILSHTDLENVVQLRYEIEASLFKDFKKASSIKRRPYLKLKEDYSEFINSIDEDSIVYVVIVPSKGFFSFRNSLPQNFVRVLPNYYQVAQDLKYTFQEHVVRLGLRFELPFDHPGQNILKCIDYTNFGSFGPFWPSYSPDATSFSYKKPGPIKSVLYNNLIESKLDYELINDDILNGPNGDDDDTYDENHEPFSRDFNKVQALLLTSKKYDNKFRHAVSYYQKVNNKTFRGNYLTFGKKGIITFSGSVIFQENYFFASEDCYNKRVDYIKFSDKLFRNSLMKMDYEFKDLFIFNSTDEDFIHRQKLIKKKIKQLISPELVSKKLDHYETVFIISAYRSSDYDQFILNSLSRLAFSLDIIHNDPSIKIHIFTSEHTIDKKIRTPSDRMRNRLLSYLKISPSRIINETVTADNIIIPRPSRCKFPISNLYNIQYISNKILHGVINLITKESKLLNHPKTYLPGISSVNDILNINNPYIMAIKANEEYFSKSTEYNQKSKSVFDSSLDQKRYILIFQRYNKSNGKSSAYYWSDSTYKRIINSFKKYFPDYNFLLVSDKYEGTKEGIDFYTSTIINFARADIIVSSQGPFLSNIMFTKPNSLIIQINGDVNDEALPGCGEDLSLSAIFGHDHLLYAHNFAKSELIDSDYIASETLIYFNSLINHRLSFNSNKKLIKLNKAKMQFINAFNAEYPFLWYNIKNVDHFYNRTQKNDYLK